MDATTKGTERREFRTKIDNTNEMVEDEKYKNRNKNHPQDFTRDRKMPFKNLIYFILTSVKSSSQNALERYFEKVEPTEHMSQQAFSEARQKINYTAFLKLFQMTSRVSYEFAYKKWHGYRVSAIDGTKINLPSDPKLKKYYGMLSKYLEPQSKHSLFIFFYETSENTRDFSRGRFNAHAA